jgi:hypothetical protein
MSVGIHIFLLCLVPASYKGYSKTEINIKIKLKCLRLFKLFYNSVALVRKQTIPTERPPPVGEVSANFGGYRVSRSQRDGSPRPLISIF